MSAASTIPLLAIGFAPPARAIRNTSHAAVAATAPSSAVKTHPPRYTNTTVTGAAITEKITRRVSSDTSSDFHDFCFFPLQQIVDFHDVLIVQLLQILLGVFYIVL